MHKIIKVLSICTVVIIFGAFFVIPAAALKDDMQFSDFLVAIHNDAGTNSYYNSAVAHSNYQQFISSQWLGYDGAYKTVYVYYSDSNFKVVDNILYSPSPVGCEAIICYYGGTSSNKIFVSGRSYSKSFSQSSRVISDGGNSYYYYAPLPEAVNNGYLSNNIVPLTYEGGSGPLLYYKNLDATKPLSDRELAENIDYLIPGVIQPDGKYIPFGFSDEQQSLFDQDYEDFNESFKDGEAFDPSFSKEPTENLLTQISSFFKANADDAEPIKITGTIFGVDLDLTLLDPSWFNIPNYAFLRLIFQLVISWHLLQFLVSLLFDILDIRHKGIFSTEGTVYDEEDQVTIMYSYDAEDLY